MRIAIDLYACQTGSHLRGIGRYVKDWSLAMAGTTPADDQAFYLANGTLDQDFERVRRFLTPHVSPGQLKPYFHPAHLGQFQSGTRYREASALITQAYSLLDPDWLVVPSWMEGFGHPGLVPDLDNLPNSTRKAAILYDLIPLIFEAQYLPKHLQSFRDFYLKRLESLRELDLYLALSEATKRDAVTYLGLDPARIHVIYAGVSNQFQPRFYSEPEALRMGQHLGISKPFIFYVGNVDYRKNMHGAIQAFAKLPSPLRRSHQLVLNAVAEPHTFIRQLEQLGLNRDQLVLTGHISDTELVFLYNRCSVFFLPSLYEGFGLPLLEAMACGAPVLGANNSSIPEIIQNRDALFNAEDPSAIAQSLERVLSDRDWANHLRTQGLERSREFSWEKAAICAWQALHAHACKSPGSNSDQQMAQTLKPLIEADPQRWHKMKRSWTRCAAFHLGYLRPFRVIWAGTHCDVERLRPWLESHFVMEPDWPIWVWSDPLASGDPTAKVFRLNQYEPCIGDLWFVELAYQARWQKVAKKVRSVAGRSFAVCGVADRPRFQADLFDFWLDFSGPQVVLDVISPS